MNRNILMLKSFNISMGSIYELMKRDWETYCLMSGIMLIEEMRKPTTYIRVMSLKDRKAKYTGFHTLRLKIKDLDIIYKWWKITRLWEKKLNLNLLGPTFKRGPKIEKNSGQYYLIFSPIWLFNVLKSTGKFPSQYTLVKCTSKLYSMTYKRCGSRYLFPKKEVESILNKNNYKRLYKDKTLAAGAFIISFDLEFRGITTGTLSLCMTDRYKDFLQFMLKVANKWGWATSDRLSKVSIEYSLKRNIKASPKSEFRLKVGALKDIYSLAGPLANKEKDNYTLFHIKRYKMNNTPGKPKKTKQKIISILKKNSPMKSTELQFFTNVRIDVILLHLNDLVRQGIVEKERQGKRYLWGITNANKRFN